ncbi:MAG TPA: MnmC family methyltransferase [Burkholderiales bacterium]|nr:MnmC family methyltransferase [Burkholderiales bacterium]
MSPLLTREVQEALRAAGRSGTTSVVCSLDLERSRTSVDVDASGWAWHGRHYPWIGHCRDRTIYHWTGDAFEPVQRFTHSLVKLVPTRWGTPVFEIDGIKMLVSESVSPWGDAERKVASIEPRGKIVLDTCGGLGYFAAWCMQGGARRVMSYEKNPDVIWLRGLNPWSPPASGALDLIEGDIAEEIRTLPAESVDAILHDPPRFGIAGELYSGAFYEQMARVIKRRGRLFHYTGTPNKLTSGRDLPTEVAKRLKAAGFATEMAGDGVTGVRK